MIINFELYRYFRETARAGNVTKAARSLYVSQSAVSQAIKQLESKLGCKLFDRNARGVRLTAEGETLYSYADGAIALIENAQEKIMQMKDLRAGEIKIGASDTSCSLFLLPYLEKFTAKYPEIRISVVNRTTRELIELLKNGSVDISFVNLPVDDLEEQEITPVMRIHDCFAAGAKYAYLADSVMCLEDLGNYPVLMLEKSSNTRRQMDRFLSERGLEIRPSIELESLSLVAEFAKIGLGVAATIKEDIQGMLDRRELFELRLAEKPPVRSIGLARRKGVSLSVAAEAFKKFVAETGNVV